jgi:serine/threonine protein kinase
MHARGLVHLDLRHRSNVLAGEDGHPVLLDFASALHFDPTTWWGRCAVSLLGRIDLRALDKWRARLV